MVGIVKTNQKTNSSFEPQNLVVVDHNCGEGKSPDDNGQCQTMEWEHFVLVYIYLSKIL